MTMDVLEAVKPPLCDATLRAMHLAVTSQNIGVSTLAILGMDGIRSVCGVESLLDCARVVEAVQGQSMAPPPPGPVQLRVKLGFQNVSAIDTVAGTLYASFFLDTYYNDPRLKGASSVPASTWRPEGIYIANSQGGMTCDLADDRPSLVDIGPDGKSANGLLLWPCLYHGSLRNPMDLRDFPFDRDFIEIFIHQAENASAAQYVFRPFGDAEEEGGSVRFFFDVAQERAPPVLSRSLRWEPPCN